MIEENNKEEKMKGNLTVSTKVGNLDIVAHLEVEEKDFAGIQSILKGDNEEIAKVIRGIINNYFQEKEEEVIPEDIKEPFHFTTD